MTDELHEDDWKDNYQPMTDRTSGQMTDETRDEIVRLARKGLDREAIIARARVQWRDLTGEQVAQVVDEADREVERMLTPSVPQASLGLGRVYNEVYCARAYQVTVEDAIMALAKEHPEWMLDMSRGSMNWEDADE